MEHLEPAPEEPNFLTDYHHTVTLMKEVEGPGWLDTEQAMNEGPLGTARQRVEREKPIGPLNQVLGAPWICKIPGMSNRSYWDIFADGSIQFSLSHTSGAPTPEDQEKMRRAKELGFRVIS